MERVWHALRRHTGAGNSASRTHDLHISSTNQQCSTVTTSDCVILRDKNHSAALRQHLQRSAATGTEGEAAANASLQDTCQALKHVYFGSQERLAIVIIADTWDLLDDASKRMQLLGLPHVAHLADSRMQVASSWHHVCAYVDSCANKCGTYWGVGLVLRAKENHKDLVPTPRVFTQDSKEIIFSSKPTKELDGTIPLAMGRGYNVTCSEVVRGGHHLTKDDFFDGHVGYCGDAFGLYDESHVEERQRFQVLGLDHTMLASMTIALGTTSIHGQSNTPKLISYDIDSRMRNGLKGEITRSLLGAMRGVYADSPKDEFGNTTMWGLTIGFFGDEKDNAFAPHVVIQDDDVGCVTLLGVLDGSMAQNQTPRLTTAKAHAHDGKAVTDLLPKDNGAIKQKLLDIIQAHILKDLPEDFEHRALMDMGLDSLDMVRVAMELSKVMKEALPSTLLFDYPSIDLLSTHLSTREQSRRVGSMHDTDASPIIGKELATVGIGKKTTRKKMTYLHATSSRMASPTTSNAATPKPIPLARWDIEGLMGGDINAIGNNIWFGSFIDGYVENFDGDVFGVTDNEANSMDPQQRLLLEETLKSIVLKETCQPRERMKLGTRQLEIATFVGAQAMDYMQLRRSYGIGFGAFTSTGGDASVLAGRVSYTYGFTGPAVQCATACSSSLVAVHMGQLELESPSNGASESALCAGVSLTLSSSGYMAFAAAGMLCSDGHCKTLDASANGYGRSEACSSTWLSGYGDDAEQKWDITCMIVGSTNVNQDGRSSSLTAPNGPSQQAIIKDAMDMGGMKSKPLVSVEMHGTGTPLGDPIEIGALCTVLESRIDELDACISLQAAKSARSHAEAAAACVGLAHIAKYACKLQNSTIVGLTTINPHVIATLERSNITAHMPRIGCSATSSKKLHSWSSTSISSFAFMGTNAHAILQHTQELLQPCPAIILKWQQARHWYIVQHAHPIISKARTWQGTTNGTNVLRVHHITFEGNGQYARMNMSNQMLVQGRGVHPLSMVYECFMACGGHIMSNKSSLTLSSACDRLVMEKTCAWPSPSSGVGATCTHQQVVINSAEGSSCYIEAQNSPRSTCIFSARCGHPLIDHRDYNGSPPANHRGPMQLVLVRHNLSMFSTRGIISQLGPALSRLDADKLFVSDPTLAEGGTHIAHLLNQNTVSGFECGIQGSTKLLCYDYGRLSAYSCEMDEPPTDTNVHWRCTQTQDTWSMATRHPAVNLMDLNLRSNNVGIFMGGLRVAEHAAKHSWQKKEVETANLTALPNRFPYLTTFCGSELCVPSKWETKETKWDRANTPQFSIMHGQYGVVANKSNFMTFRCQPRVDQTLALTQRMLSNINEQQSVNMALPFTDNEELGMVTSLAAHVGDACHGLIRTVALETPNIRWKVSRHDLVNPWTRSRPHTLYQQEHDSYGVKLQGQLVEMPILSRSSSALSITKETRSRIESSILITGGLGGLGLLIATWASAGHRATRVLTLGRSGRCNLDAWNALSTGGAGRAEVTAQGCDAAVEADVHELAWGRPSVVVHSGGVLQDATLPKQDASRLRKVVAPKAVGIDLLACHAGAMEADVTMVFSSVTSFMGTVGQANYAMANAMLDAWAGRAIKMGVAARSIQWGAWAEVGMAAENSVVKRYFESRGLDMVLPISGLNALKLAWCGVLGSDHTGPLLASPLIASRLQRLPHTGELAAIFGDLVVASTPNKQGSITHHVSKLKPQRGGQRTVKPIAPLVVREPHVVAKQPTQVEIASEIKQMVASILGDTTTLEDTMLLMEAGLDSLAVVELRNELGSRYEIEMPATLVLDYPTVGELTTFVHDRLREGIMRGVAPREVGSMPPGGLALDDVMGDVKQIVSGIMGDVVGDLVPLMGAGLDSLGVMELRNALGEKFGMELPATLVLDYPTQRDIAHHLHSSIEPSNTCDIYLSERALGQCTVSSLPFEEIATEVAAIVEGILGSHVQSDTVPLMEAGLDSLGVLELRNEMKRTFGMELPATLVLDHPTIGSLARFVSYEMASNGGKTSIFDSHETFQSSFGSTTDLSTEVAAIVQGIIGLEIGCQDPLMGAGLDSLASVELCNELSARFEMELPSTLVMDNPTISEISRWLHAEMGISNQCSALKPSKRALSSLVRPIARKIAIPRLATSRIVSAAGLYPGCVRQCGLDAFGTNVVGEKELCLPIPPARWDVESNYNPDGPSGTSFVRVGIFVGGLEDFDNEAFGVSKAEALGMDPQARVLLELTNATVQGGVARIDTNEIVKCVHDMGVYVGVIYEDYEDLIISAGQDSTKLSVVLGCGISPSILAGRVSYTFGSQGPCLSTDTACSSSLVSTHLAHNSLLRNESYTAITCGLNSMVTPKVTIQCCTLNALSPNGRSKSFDQSADGYGRGEAFAAMLLTRDGDGANLSPFLPSLGVLCGSAVNQDGRSSGLTAPNGPAQSKLILQALKSGDLACKELRYVAVHGTGTPLGDPIEMGALSNAAACGEPKWLGLGSVKSCYGHTEGAAGITGLWLATFGVQVRAEPGIMHLRTPNPHVTATWKDWVSKSKLWPWAPRQAGGGTMVESIATVGSTSSFGISGVNAHCCVRPVASKGGVGQAPVSKWVGHRYWPVSPSHGMGLRFVVEPLSGQTPRVVLESDMGKMSMGFAQEHVVQGRVLLPGSAIYESMLVGGAITIDHDWQQSSKHVGTANITLESAIMIPQANAGVIEKRMRFVMDAHVGSGKILTSMSSSMRYAEHARNEFHALQLSSVHSRRVGHKASPSELFVPGLHNNSDGTRSLVIGRLDSPVGPCVHDETSFANHPCIIDASSHTLFFKGTSQPSHKKGTTALQLVKNARVPVALGYIGGVLNHTKSTTCFMAPCVHTTSCSWVANPLNTIGNNHTFVTFGYMAESKINEMIVKVIPSASRHKHKKVDTLSITRMVACHATQSTEQRGSLGDSTSIILEDIASINIKGQNSMLEHYHPILQASQSLARIKSTTNTTSAVVRATLPSSHESGCCPFGHQDHSDRQVIAEACHGLIRTATLESTNVRWAVTRVDTVCPKIPPTPQSRRPQETDSYGTQTQGSCATLPLLLSSTSSVATCSAKDCCRGDGSILITGGLGGLGLLIATWASAGHRATRVLTLGRSGRCNLDAWNALSTGGAGRAEVTAQGCDAAVEADVHELAWGRPSVVVHSGGVLQDATLPKQDASRLRKVVAPKAVGIDLLACHAGAMEADVTMVFSSVTSFMGTVGQANYAMANAMLDAWAGRAIKMGVAARSIQWGAWAEVGMAAGNKAVMASLAARGLSEVLPISGLNALKLAWCGALGSDHTGPLLASPLIASRLQRLPHTGELAAIFGDLVVASTPNKQGSITHHVSKLKPQRGGQRTVKPIAPLVVREPHVVAKQPTQVEIASEIKQMVASILGDTTTLEDTMPLMEAGLDSLAVVELRNELGSRYEIEMPATLVLDYPTVGELTTFVHDRLRGGIMRGVAPRKVGSMPPGGVALDDVMGDVKQIVSGIMGDVVGDLVPLMGAGLDSLGVMELRNELGEKFGMELPATLVLDYPTQRDIAYHLHSSIGASRARETSHGMRGVAPREVGSMPPGGVALDDVLGDVKQIVSGIMGDVVGDLVPLMGAGLDSLGVMELRNELGEKFGMELPATLVLDYPTQRDMANHLLSSIGASRARETSHGMRGVAPREVGFVVLRGMALDDVLGDVKQIVSGIMGDVVGDLVPLMGAGLDSLGVMELRNELGEKFGMELPATLVLDYPTQRDIAHHLRSSIVAFGARDTIHHLDGIPIGALSAKVPLPLEDLVADLVTIVEGILGSQVESKVVPLMEAGLDSLGVVELRNEMEATFGMEFPATLVLDHPTIGDLASYVIGRHGDKASPRMADHTFEDGNGVTLADIMQEVKSLVRMILEEGGCDASTPLMEAGLDSLGAVELRNEMEEKFEMALPATLVLDCPTMSDIAAFVFQEARGMQGTSTFVGGKGLNFTKHMSSDEFALPRLVDDVASIVSNIVGSQFDAAQPLMEAGLDSLGSVELRNELEAKFSLDLPATFVLDHPTVEDMAMALRGFIDVGQLSFRSSPTEDPSHGNSQIGPTKLKELEHEVASIVHGIIGSGIGWRDPLMGAGLDSLGAVELRIELSARFEMELPSTLVMDSPTISEISRWLHAEMGMSNLAPTNAAFQQPRRAIAPLVRPMARKIATPRLATSRIVSAAGLYPGCVRQCGLDAFGKNVVGEKELCLPIPPARWDVESNYNPDGPSGTSFVRVGIFVGGLEDFDNEAFGVSKAEALGMDPNARVLLELTNAAVQGGARLGDGDGDLSYVREMSVNIGICLYSDYFELTKHSSSRLVSNTTIMGTGMGPSLVVGRISYMFGSQGPCLSTDTACSSSLVSTHLAHNSLLRMETSISLTAGANAMVREHVSLMFCALKTLSPNGRSKSFDQSADGYGRGEAFAAMLLARDGDGANLSPFLPSLGVLCGSAVNQDGRSSGLTAPNGPAQSKLILQALKSGDLACKELRYVAVHGTGTPLGDPIEMGALSNAAACGEPKWLGLGSVKSCYGHTEGAAGITGLWLATFGVQVRAEPGIMHLRTPNPHVTATWKDWVSKSKLWPWAPRQAGGGTMVESIATVGSTSSFGISGVNAHCCVRPVASKGGVGQAHASKWVGHRYWPVSPSHGMGLRFVVEPLSGQTPRVVLESDMGKMSMGFAQEHVVQGRVLLPGSAIYESMLVGGAITIDHDWQQSSKRVGTANITLESAIMIPQANAGVIEKRMRFVMDAHVGSGKILTSMSSSMRYAEHARNEFHALKLPTKYFRRDDSHIIANPYSPLLSVVNNVWDGTRSLAVGWLDCPVGPCVHDETSFANHPCIIDAATHTTAFTFSTSQCSLQCMADGLGARIPTGVGLFCGLLAGSQSCEATKESFWLANPSDACRNSHTFRTHRRLSSDYATSISDLRLRIVGNKISSKFTKRTTAIARHVEWTSDKTGVAHALNRYNMLSIELPKGIIFNVKKQNSMLEHYHPMLQASQSLARIKSTTNTTFAVVRATLPSSHESGCCPFGHQDHSDRQVIAEACHGLIRTATLESTNVRWAVTRVDTVCPKIPPTSQSRRPQETDSYGTQAQGSCATLPLLLSSTSSVATCSAKDCCRGDGSILITGGLGGLGLLIATWASAGHRATRALTLGRSGRCNLDAWNALSTGGAGRAEVTAQGCDAAVEADVHELAWGRPSVVVHSGGVLQDATLPKQDASRLRKVVAPKAVGIDLLACHAGAMEADVTIVFSSVTSFMGTVGQANYAMANAMLDAWAGRAIKMGVAARSIQWGAWAEVGMAAGNKAVMASLDAKGLSLVEPKKGLNALKLAWCGALGRDHTGPLLASPLIASRLQRLPHTGELAAIFGDLVVASTPNKQGSITHHVSKLKPQRGGQRTVKPIAPLVVREPHVVAKQPTQVEIASEIKQMVASILGDTTTLEDTMPLMEAGLDSLAVVELRNELGSRYEIEMPATLVLDHPTVGELTTFVHDRLREGIMRGVAPREVGSMPPGGVALDDVMGDVKQIVSGIMGDVVGDLVPLMGAGLDSLGVMELRNELGEKFGMELPATMVLDYPTQRDIAYHLHSSIGASRARETSHGMRGVAPREVGSMPPGGVALDDVFGDVKQIVSGIMGDVVGDLVPLMDAGLDSLGVMELRNELGEKFGMELPATLVLDYPTQRDIAHHLRSSIVAFGARDTIHHLDWALSAKGPLPLEDLVADLVTIVEGILGSQVESKVVPLMEAGLDSLGVVELRNEMEATFGMEFPATLVLDHPTIGDLASYVIGRHGDKASPRMADHTFEDGNGVTLADIMQEVKSLVRMILEEGGCDASTPLMEAGLDSLGAVELRNEMEEKFEMALPATLVLDCPTMSDIAAFVFQEVRGMQGTSTFVGGKGLNFTKHMSSDEFALPRLVDDVTSIVSNIIGSQFDAAQPLMEAGLDSLGSVELRNELEAKFSLDLPATFVLDHPTVEDMAMALRGFIDVGQLSFRSSPIEDPSHGNSQIGPTKLKELEHEVASIVQGIIGSGIGWRDPLMGAGLDSLGAIELRNELSARFEMELPSTFVMDSPTISEISRWLHAEMGMSNLAPTNAAFQQPRRAIAPLVRPMARKIATPRLATSRIVSAAGLYPGCVRQCGLDAFGKNVVGEKELCLPIPPERWDVESNYNPDGPSGTSFVRVGIFVGGLEDFDNEAFGVSKAEALGMDPQARVLLELTNAAVQGGARLGDGDGDLSYVQNMGVFVGILYSEYGNLVSTYSARSPSTNTIMGTGMGSSLVVGRISYMFGSQGPCLSTDTACSSSLVSTHLAHNSLLRMETSISLTAGANSMVREHVSLMFCALKTLSPNGRSKSFDQSADGYGRGEAFAAMLLARDGDGANLSPFLPSLGVLCGSAVNQDGRSSGLTAPNGPAQSKLILQALKSGDLACKELRYVAVHGTGTPLGDPIEMGALSNAAACGEPKWLGLGSVKSCYGHTEGAAGITGLWLATFGVQVRAEPGIMHLRTPNPHVTATWKDWVSKSKLWPWAPRQAGGGTMVESIATVGSTSSFGISGVNAHCCVRPVASKGGVGQAPVSKWVGHRYWPVSPSHVMGLRFVVEPLSGQTPRVVLESDMGKMSMGFAQEHVVQGRVNLPAVVICESMLVGGAIAMEQDWRQGLHKLATTRISLDKATFLNEGSIVLRMCCISGDLVLQNGSMHVTASGRLSHAKIHIEQNSCKAMPRAFGMWQRRQGFSFFGKHFHPFITTKMKGNKASKSKARVEASLGLVAPRSSLQNEGMPFDCMQLDASSHLLRMQRPRIIAGVFLFSKHAQDKRAHQCAPAWSSEFSHKNNYVKSDMPSVAIRSLTCEASYAYLRDVHHKSIKKSKEKAIVGTSTKRLLLVTQFGAASSVCIGDCAHMVDDSQYKTSIGTKVFVCGNKHSRNHVALSIGQRIGALEVSIPRKANSALSVHLTNEIFSARTYNHEPRDFSKELFSEAFHSLIKTVALETPNIQWAVTRGDPTCPTPQSRWQHKTDSYGIQAQGSCAASPLLLSSASSVATCSAKDCCRGDGSILITGGLGGLGLLIATWASAGHRATRVLTLGRSGRCNLDAWNALSTGGAGRAEVTAQGCDAAVEADVHELAWGRPSVVVHSGGVLQDATLPKQDASRLRKVVAPKAVGIDLLACHAGAMEADVTMVFSSVTSFMGTVGQANYAMANAMLDAWAGRATKMGVAARSIQWGAWAEVGMAAGNKAVMASLDAKGLSLLKPREGLTILSSLVSPWSLCGIPKMVAISSACPLADDPYELA